MNPAPVCLERTRSMGIGPIPTEDLEKYSSAARRSAQGLHLVLASSWGQREAVKQVLKREFGRIISFLLFKGREVPQDTGLLDAIQQCPAGGMIIIHGSHSVPVLKVQKPLRLEGVGHGPHKTLLRTHLVVEPKSVQHPPILSRGVTARFQDSNEAALEDKPPRMTVQLHQIHLMQPAAEHDSHPAVPDAAPRFGAYGYGRDGGPSGPDLDSQFKVRNPDDVDKPLPDPQKSLLCVGAGARAQVTQCLLEEAPDSTWGCGIFVERAGRLEAVESVVKNAAEYGLVTFGTSKLAQCRIMGSKVGVRLVGAQRAQLLLKACIVQDNRDIGVYLPPVWDFDHNSGERHDESTWPFRCILKGSSVTKSWYPIAQKMQSDTRWERYPWVEPPDDFVGLRMDTSSQLQELTEADYDRHQDLEDEGAPSRCPSSLWSDGYDDCEDDWEWTHGRKGAAPPVPKQKVNASSSQQHALSLIHI